MLTGQGNSMNAPMMFCEFCGEQEELDLSLFQTWWWLPSLYAHLISTRTLLWCLRSE